MSFPFSAPAWYRALALAERRPAPGTASDLALGRRRLERWRSEPPFAEEPDLFAQRLAADDLSEDDFLALLGESETALAARLPFPEALAELEDIFAEYASGPGAELPLPPFEVVANRTGAGFLGLVLPLLRAGYDRLRRGLEALGPEAAARLAPEATGPQFFNDLLLRLFALLPRTLVLELSAARLEGTLEGDTTEARFDSFASRLRDPQAALAILLGYPVLARLALTTVRDWVAASLETCRRLRDDWQAIVATFSPEGDPGPLIAVRLGAGDLHRGGRSVTLLRFAAGLRLVYKPRSLAAEAAFQDFLAWTNARGFTPALPLLRVLDRGSDPGSDQEGHGWVEFVAARPCAEPDEVGRFYERQGGYLALFYLLDASDQHHENILAVGEYPYAVDLETLFHPRVDGPRVEDPEEIPGSALFHSVLRVGLLPKWIAGPGGARLDAGGLASVAGQESRHPLLELAGEGTDEMRFGRRTLTMPGAKNLPVLGGREAELPDYANELTAGFGRMLRLLLAHRAELLADGGPLDAFATAETRVVFRPTATYSELLTESVHPDVLGNALFRDQLFDRLWVAVARKPYLARLIAAERADLARGDVPLFTTRPGSTDLETSLGTLPGFFGETGISRVRQNVRRLSEADVALQLFTLHGCLTALDLSRRMALTAPYQLRPTAGRPDPGALLSAARAVGDRLETIAFRGPRDAWWLTLAALDGGRWAFATAQAELYEGVPGIVLFLAYLGEATGEARYTDLARRGVETILALLDRGTATRRLAGAWNGLGGLVYAFAHLAVLWKDESLLDRAESWLPEIATLAASDETFDLMSGVAGGLAALLVLHELRPAAGALEIARRCGERLAAGALPMARGVAWPPAVPGFQPLVGFSHGSAGIGWALLRLAAAIRKEHGEEPSAERFRELGLAAIEYERSVYDPAQKNWPDFREFGGPVEKLHEIDPFMSAWCNGAAGIGLARLDTLAHLDDAQIREEIAAAVATTLARGFGKNHCLCHGDLGNLELLLQAAWRLGDPALEEKAWRIAGGILADIEVSGWRLGAPKGTEPPGLLVGLAGIGYGLLRLAAPDRVPAVLLLAGPPSSSRTR
jgi:type 2 lantibiotic biosynthesis protein LanM